MFERNSDPSDRARSSYDTITEYTGLARDFRARAERYRRLAESLFDENIVAVVLACARELDQHADAISEAQPRSERPE